MSDGTFTCKCFLCGKEHSMGPHIYDGKWVRYYEMQVCKWCYDGNHDGWNPSYEEKILNHIHEKGIEEPERNDDGLLPRDIY